MLFQPFGKTSENFQRHQAYQNLTSHSPPALDRIRLHGAGEWSLVKMVKMGAFKHDFFDETKYIPSWFWKNGPPMVPILLVEKSQVDFGNPKLKHLDVCCVGSLNEHRIPTSGQRVSNHLLSRFHYHSQKVIGSLGKLNSWKDLKQKVDSQTVKNFLHSQP